jgi:hypothetical protein
VDFVHRLDKIYKNIKSRRFGRRFFFRPQVNGGETPTQMGPLDRANQLPKRRFLYFYIFYPDDGQSPKDSYQIKVYSDVNCIALL